MTTVRVTTVCRLLLGSNIVFQVPTNVTVCPYVRISVCLLNISKFAIFSSDFLKIFVEHETVINIPEEL